MKILNILFAGSLFLFLISCGDDATGEVKEEQKACTYTYNHGSTDLTWTAYKTNAKVPVSGGFNIIQVASVPSTSPKEVIESIQFTIETNSVETNNVDRNKKLDSIFFSSANAPNIKGKFVALKDNGMAEVEISMAGISYNIEGKYKLNEGHFVFNSEIKLIWWNLLGATELLNIACYDLHTGDDGVSKLWDVVDLSLTMDLTSDCN